MATKTISIDLTAYKRLKRVKRDNESFSETIKRLVPEPLDVDAWFANMRKNRLDDRAVRAVENQVAGRRRRSSRGRPHGLP